MVRALKTALTILSLCLPTQILAQSIVGGPDTARLATLIRVNLCEQTCRAGQLSAQRYQSPNRELENGYKLYVLTTRNKRQCRGRTCAQALIAVNRSDLLNLGEGFNLDPSRIALPEQVAKRDQATPRRIELCKNPTRQLNTALIRRTFIGRTAVGQNDRGQAWSEYLGDDGTAILTNANGRQIQGRFEIRQNQICAGYGKAKATCKAVYECISGEGPFVFADNRERLTGIVTKIVAGAPKPTPKPTPKPKPQVSAPSKDVVAELAQCRAIASEIQRLNCYDTLAGQAAPANFGREERRRLLRLMNFELSNGRLLVETQLDRCDLNVFVDLPQGRNAFSNETLIDLRALDIAASGGEIDEGTALFRFVSKSSKGWKEIYTDRRRGTQRETQKREVTVPVTASSGNLAEVEKLIVAAAKQCQR